VIPSRFDGNADSVGVTKALSQNTDDLTAAITSVYGEAGGAALSAAIATQFPEVFGVGMDVTNIWFKIGSSEMIVDDKSVTSTKTNLIIIIKTKPFASFCKRLGLYQCMSNLVYNRVKKSH
jgi:hypothetical protein